VVEWGGGCRIDAAGGVGRRLGVGTCSKGGEGGGGDQWRSRWVAIVAIAGDRGRRRGSRDGGGGGVLTWQPGWWMWTTRAVVTWQPGWWMWTTRAGDGADVATETGGAGDDGLVGDVARPGAANR
jgi:hypothetical protein